MGAINAVIFKYVVPYIITSLLSVNKFTAKSAVKNIINPLTNIKPQPYKSALL